MGKERALASSTSRVGPLETTKAGLSFPIAAGFSRGEGAKKKGEIGKAGAVLIGNGAGKQREEKAPTSLAEDVK